MVTIKGTDPAKGGQYRDETDMYYRSGRGKLSDDRKGTWRAKNSGVIVNAGARAPKSTLERLKQLNAKNDVKTESAYANVSGYDKMAKEIRRANMTPRREALALGRLKMQQNRAIRNGMTI